MHTNELLASEIRQRLDQADVFGLNIMASPGAGKTTFITSTINRLQSHHPIGYIDGDIATTIDAEKIARLGVPVVQINTGGNCHLDANMLNPALDKLPLDEIDVLLLENVGNLICPANFQLGTHLNVLVASIPEGDDKPYKYPGMYRGVDVLILNKIDLLPYIPFNLDYFLQGVQTLNPNVTIFQLSALHNEGIIDWVTWLVEYYQTEKLKNEQNTIAT
ncbi:hydrogenase nickel incorporation protein HypB [Anaerolineales bacterium HSG24]|nr:hydrogenase nickel incorporation protein HypB [Anaerolineales bacterium HSG24]